MLPNSFEHLALCSKAWSDATYLDEIPGQFRERLTDQMKREVNEKALEYSRQVMVLFQWVDPRLAMKSKSMPSLTSSLPFARCGLRKSSLQCGVRWGVVTGWWLGCRSSHSLFGVLAC